MDSERDSVGERHLAESESDCGLLASKVLQDPATRPVWEDKGMVVPEDVTPQAYQAESIERIQFCLRIVPESQRKTEPYGPTYTH